jgi:hypothetical protein
MLDDHLGGCRYLVVKRKRVVHLGLGIKHQLPRLAF